MTIFSSPSFVQKKPIRYHGDSQSVMVMRDVVTFAAAPVTTDTINFFFMPPYARIVGGYALPTDMDTGGPTLTINIGDAGSATRIFSALACGVPSVASPIVLATAIGFQYTVKTLVTAVVQANATTGAAGSLELALLYFVDDPAVSP